MEPNLKLTGLLGHPVAHSRSPQMHNAAFTSLGMPYVYMAFDIQPGQLGAAVEGIRALGIRGVNVTIPYKVEVMDYLDELAPSAEHIGAVNTIVNENGKLIGHNTDGSGYIRSLLEETGVELSKSRVLVLGAGGASRAICVSFALKGVKEILVANRSLDKAQELAERVSGLCTCKALTIDEAADIVRDMNLIVNTTSVGMSPNIEDTPMDPRLIQQGQIVSDLIYNPKETKFLKEARRQGATPHSGMGMFIYQGAEAFELWTGVPAPVEIMRTVIESAL